MVQFDLSPAELEAYESSAVGPSDLDEFWAATLETARNYPLDVTWAPVATGLLAFDTFDVTFPGFDGQPVRGWLHLPREQDRAGARGLPAVVQYHGYGGGRGRPHETMLWAVAGYAHFVMDTRGQGSRWSAGATPDPVGSGPSHPGFLTRGIEDPATYYYRRVFTDAVRAVEATRSHPAIDAGRVAVMGGSQGGAITIAAGALMPDVIAVMADVPFLSDPRRAIEITDAEPYAELANYLAIHRDRLDQAFRTLSYFDASVLATRCTAPALFSVGLADVTCPPSTVYAAYNRYAGPKQISVYPYNGHEGGQADHARVQLDWLAELID